MGNATDMMETDRLATDLLRCVRIDEMTGLYNHVYFFDRLRDDMHRCRRYGWPLALLVVRLDEFNGLCEQRGKVTGDTAVATVASMLRKLARETDIAGRLGPAEFGLILPGTPTVGADAIADRLRQRIGSLLLRDVKGQELEVRCAVGASPYQPNFETTEQFCADARLACDKIYQA